MSLCAFTLSRTLSHSLALSNTLSLLQVLRSLSHTNIVKYLGSEINTVTATLNIFLEYAPGGSLRQQLNDNWGPLKPTRCAECTLQILHGLNYLHNTAQICHRDVKGANVLVAHDGSLKLTDFGASKRAEAASIVSGLKGTPHWMAPEVIKGQQGDGGWPMADVWSVGCTVIEMLTAQVSTRASERPASPVHMCVLSLVEPVFSIVGQPPPAPALHSPLTLHSPNALIFGPQMPWSVYPNPMAAMYHIANGEKPPLPAAIEQDLPPLALEFLYDCCCCPDPSKRWTVAKLLTHPFLAPATEEALMARAEGVAPAAIAAESQEPTRADKERRLPATPVEAPAMPRRPKKKKEGKRERRRKEDANESRPLPRPTAKEVGSPPPAEARPQNRGGRTEINTASLSSAPLSTSSPPASLADQQSELRRMMDEQSRKTLKLQQEIDEQQAKVQRLREQEAQQSALQMRMNASSHNESPRYAKLKKYSGGGMPSPRVGMQPMQVAPMQGMQDARPSGAQAGMFGGSSNSYNQQVRRAKNSSLSIRQQALEELTRGGGGAGGYGGGRSSRTISAGVSGACVTPKAGLSRTLPPLQSLREHSVGVGMGGERVSVPMLPLRHIASAPTAVLQPILAEAKKQMALAPLDAGGAAQVHAAEKEERRKRKERRKSKQRGREREEGGD